jgi:hypothetical protein
VADLLLPSQSLSLGFTLNETFALFQSPHYCLQYPSLSLIYFYLQHDLTQLRTLQSSPPPPVPSSSASLTPVVSVIKVTKKLKKSRVKESLNRSTSRSSPSSTSSSWVYSPQAVLEICQNGYLRQLCWCLTHSQEIVRSFSWKVFLNNPSPLCICLTPSVCLSVSLSLSPLFPLSADYEVVPSNYLFFSKGAVF